MFIYPFIYIFIYLFIYSTFGCTRTDEFSHGWNSFGRLDGHFDHDTQDGWMRRIAYCFRGSNIGGFIRGHAVSSRSTPVL
jgi:hypothetical protein